MRKNDLQVDTSPEATGFDELIKCGTINEYQVKFVNIYSELKSWRRVAEPYGIYPNMARMISQGYDPGNKIRAKLRLPKKVKVEVCSKCGDLHPQKRCSGKKGPKRNRLSINLDNPGSASRSIIKHMDLDIVRALIEMLMEEKINILIEGRKV